MIWTTSTTTTGFLVSWREDWEQEREYLELTAGHELSDKELENNFLNNPADAFAIYQLKHTEMCAICALSHWSASWPPV